MFVWHRFHRPQSSVCLHVGASCLTSLFSLTPLRNEETRARVAVRGPEHRNIGWYTYSIHYYSTVRKLTFMLWFIKSKEAGRVVFGINAFSKLVNTEAEKHFLCCFAISVFGGYFRVATSEKCCVLLTAFWLCLVFNELLQCWECCRTVLQRMVPQIGPFESVRKLFI